MKQRTQLRGAHSVESATETLGEDLTSDSRVWLKLSSSNLPGRPVSRYKTCSHHESVDTPKGKKQKMGMCLALRTSGTDEEFSS